MIKTLFAIVALVVASVSPAQSENMNVAKTIMQMPDGTRLTVLAETPKQFEHKICNDTNEKLIIAVAYPDPDMKNGWRFNGWFHINASKCKTVSVPAGGREEMPLLYHAHTSDKQTTWGNGPSYKLPTKPFDFVQVNEGGLSVNGDLYPFTEKTLKLGKVSKTSIILAK